MAVASRRFGVVVALAALAWWGLEACGLDESGLVSDASVPDVTSDVTPNEAAPADVIVPPLSCEEAGTGLDASCLSDAGVPDGWTPIAIQTGAAACPSNAGPLQHFDFVTAPDASAACDCECPAANGAWSCDVQWKGSTACGTDLGTFPADASFCKPLNHLSYEQDITRSGQPSCPAAVQKGSMDASTTPLSACVPSDCATDFCSLAGAGFKLCIYNPAVTDGTCPAGFNAQSLLVGTSASVTCPACPACALSNTGAACTGKTTAYSDNNCQTAIDNQTASGNCKTTGGYNSLGFEPGALPVPSCALSQDAGSGVAQLGSPGTICCP